MSVISAVGKPVDLEVLTLNSEGIWLSDGNVISHEPTSVLFSRSLVKDVKGYVIKIGPESKRVIVEDTAYFITGITGDPDLGFRLKLSDQTQEDLVPDTLGYRPGRLVCRIKNGREVARFQRIPYFDLLKHLKEDAEFYYLLISTRPQVLGRI